MEIIKKGNPDRAWWRVNQPVRSAISERKGTVAMPPPTANRPVLKNSQRS